MRLNEDLRLRIKELPGHSDVSKTMIYTHVLVAAGQTASPLDTLVKV